ncbi:MAG: hypothetical protein ACK2T6_01870, partial [Anaerolineae bacterium]
MVAHRGLQLGPQLGHPLSAIAGPREGAASVVLSLGLGLSVLAAVGQSDGNLASMANQTCTYDSLR